MEEKIKLAEDLFSLLVAGRENEKRSVVALLVRAFLLKKERREVKNYMNNVLHLAGARSATRKEKMANAIEEIAGHKLLDRLRSKGAWV